MLKIINTSSLFYPGVVVLTSASYSAMFNEAGRILKWVHKYFGYSVQHLISLDTWSSTNIYCSLDNWILISSTCRYLWCNTKVRNGRVSDTRVSNTRVRNGRVSNAWVSNARVSRGLGRVNNARVSNERLCNKYKGNLCKSKQCKGNYKQWEGCNTRASNQIISENNFMFCIE